MSMCHKIIWGSVQCHSHKICIISFHSVFSVPGLLGNNHNLVSCAKVIYVLHCFIVCPLRFLHHSEYRGNVEVNPCSQGECYECLLWYILYPPSQAVLSCNNFATLRSFTSPLAIRGTLILYFISRSAFSFIGWYLCTGVRAWTVRNETPAFSKVLHNSMLCLNKE